MDIIGICISFIEILTIFLIYNILINDRIFQGIFKIGILSIITSLTYSLFVTIYSTDPLIILIGVLFLNSMLISKYEKKDTIVTFIEFIVSALLMLGFELVISFIVYVTMGNDDLSPTTYLILVTCIMSILIYLLSTNKVVKKVRFSTFFSKYKSINIIILNLFVFFLLIKVLMTNRLMSTTIIIPITILGLILIGVNCYFYVYLYKTLNEKKKSEIKTSFNPLINDLMGKLKANEHEYKNHLNTIWSIAQVTTPEEMKGKLQEYISNIVDDTEEFSMLLNVENTIIKAVLYNKGQRAEKLGVQYTYNIKSNFKDISLDNSELTVILSNLLNNAIEATSMIKKKELEVILEEDNRYYIINVKNRTEGLKGEDLSNIFKMGYSTKGEGRGYGLYNVKNIVDKYRGKIQLSLEEDIMNIKILFVK
ncbi:MULTISPECIES: GHKL domain-containing protein [unclassified Clostridium]|uniref:sensor histidine kinase n=1 Tax=Clostridium TaxID=1485 RepID=UPI001C8CB3C6|nr:MULTISPECIES: GHKL domain-containing protein [unclassified Clostridium]MBX9138535.1 GHKL domain-containing protein [Clostridium sp. K12(2020)]MBX9145240.1 GHKL domain-containing protein [Clostridium sp. K13]MDU2288849.1 GHKL domain-containing protein [Clostridium celatum]MDU4325305.1 GHKL domain-containing protein [Clostridium celatum]